VIGDGGDKITFVLIKLTRYKITYHIL